MRLVFVLIGRDLTGYKTNLAHIRMDYLNGVKVVRIVVLAHQLQSMTERQLINLQPVWLVVEWPKSR